MCHGVGNTDNSSSFASGRCSIVATQPKLGILAQRNSRDNSDHCLNPGAAGKNLEPDRESVCLIAYGPGRLDGKH
jgi:hypothetical protein